MTYAGTLGNQGLILGIQGGTDRVFSGVTLQEEQATLSAMWMQDWQGQREVAQGFYLKILWWNWELDDSRYARWQDMVVRFFAPMTFASWVISTKYFHDVLIAGNAFHLCAAICIRRHRDRGLIRTSAPALWRQQVAQIFWPTCWT